MKIPVYKLKLVRDRWASYPQLSFKHPQLAAHFFHGLIGRADREHAAALFLNLRHEPLGTTILSVGALTFTPLPAREVFKTALLANAAAILLAHNHPSNNSTPSARDIRLTKQLVQAGELLDIKVVDHIVVTPSGDFTSMLEAGLLTAA